MPSNFPIYSKWAEFRDIVSRSYRLYACNDKIFELHNAESANAYVNDLKIKVLVNYVTMTIIFLQMSEGERAREILLIQCNISHACADRNIIPVQGREEKFKIIDKIDIIRITVNVLKLML